MIPSRSHLASESYLVTGLGVSHYLNNFEAEVAAVDEHTRLVTRGSTIMRITENLETHDFAASSSSSSSAAVGQSGEINEAETAEPVAGPSGGCRHHRHRRRSARQVLLTTIPVPFGEGGGRFSRKK